MCLAHHQDPCPRIVSSRNKHHIHNSTPIPTLRLLYSKTTSQPMESLLPPVFNALGCHDYHAASKLINKIAKSNPSNEHFIVSFVSILNKLVHLETQYSSLSFLQVLSSSSSNGNGNNGNTTTSNTSASQAGSSNTPSNTTQPTTPKLPTRSNAKSKSVTITDDLLPDASPPLTPKLASRKTSSISMHHSNSSNSSNSATTNAYSTPRPGFTFSGLMNKAVGSLFSFTFQKRKRGINLSEAYTNLQTELISLGSELVGDTLFDRPVSDLYGYIIDVAQNGLLDFITLRLQQIRVYQTCAQHPSRIDYLGVLDHLTRLKTQYCSRSMFAQLNSLSVNIETELEIFTYILKTQIAVSLYNYKDATLYLFLAANALEKWLRATAINASASTSSSSNLPGNTQTHSHGTLANTSGGVGATSSVSLGTASSVLNTTSPNIPTSSTTSMSPLPPISATSPSIVSPAPSLKAWNIQQSSNASLSAALKRNRPVFFDTHGTRKPCIIVQWFMKFLDMLIAKVGIYFYALLRSSHVQNVMRSISKADSYKTMVMTPQESLNSSQLLERKASSGTEVGSNTTGGQFQPTHTAKHSISSVTTNATSGSQQPWFSVSQVNVETGSISSPPPPPAPPASSIITTASSQKPLYDHHRHSLLSSLSYNRYQSIRKTDFDFIHTIKSYARNSQPISISIFFSISTALHSIPNHVDLESVLMGMSDISRGYKSRQCCHEDESDCHDDCGDEDTIEDLLNMVQGLKSLPCVFHYSYEFHQMQKFQYQQSLAQYLQVPNNGTGTTGSVVSGVSPTASTATHVFTSQSNRNESPSAATIKLQDHANIFSLLQTNKLIVPFSLSNLPVSGKSSPIATPSTSPIPKDSTSPVFEHSGLLRRTPSLRYLTHSPDPTTPIPAYKTRQYSTISITSSTYTTTPSTNQQPHHHHYNTHHRVNTLSTSTSMSSLRSSLWDPVDEGDENSESGNKVPDSKPLQKEHLTTSSSPPRSSFTKRDPPTDSEKPKRDPIIFFYDAKLDISYYILPIPTEPFVVVVCLAGNRGGGKDDLTVEFLRGLRASFAFVDCWRGVV